MEERIGPSRPLPFTDDFSTPDAYIDSLLDFVGSSDLLRTLCGGVHILDFFTSDPSLYVRILPEEWRAFFSEHDVFYIVDLLLREDLARFNQSHGEYDTTWRNGPLPPPSLLDYIRAVRSHLLLREPGKSQCARNRAMKPTQKLSRNVVVGMNVKKVHEVGLMASYIDTLTSTINHASGEPISHLVDFGSGQNYLGRALASEPYNHNIVAVESRQANAERAKEFDVFAKLAEKQKFMVNKKAFRDGIGGPGTEKFPRPVVPAELPTPPPEHNIGYRPPPEVELPTAGNGRIQYVEHRISDGDLTDVIYRIPQTTAKKNLMIMSLHSCGNLVHHGLRSLLLNSEVKAVAMVGCCYNLLTERLGPATYKLPELRPTTHDHPRLSKTGEANDPHGFPMSQRFCDYYHVDRPDISPEDKGVRLNITSRMMAVQAPTNWGPSDSQSFFTRHFYRALLQRIFLDRGIVGPPITIPTDNGVSPAGHSSGGVPIIIGSLRKACYESFTSYVRGALAKLTEGEMGDIFKQKMSDISDAEIERYEEKYKEGKKHLSVMWSLMAFSAGVIEAAIVVDRYLWLNEQDEVKEAWVEPIFDYKFSPRNLVVVGVKK